MSQNNQDSEKYNPNDIPVMRFEPKRLTVRELKEIVNQCDDEQGVFLYDHTDSDSWRINNFIPFEVGFIFDQDTGKAGVLLSMKKPKFIEE